MASYTHSVFRTERHEWFVPASYGDGAVFIGEYHKAYYSAENAAAEKGIDTETDTWLKMRGDDGGITLFFEIDVPKDAK